MPFPKKLLHDEEELVLDMMPNRPRPEALRLHTAVARAIRDGLPDVAEAAMRSIVTEVATALEHNERPLPQDLDATSRSEGRDR